MSKPPAKPADVTVKVVDLLTPLTSEDRLRVVNAALLLLGETDTGGIKNETPAQSGGGDAFVQHDSSKPVPVQAWMKKNEITEDHISQVFHYADDEVQVIAADVPGSTNKPKTVNAYIIGALGSFLKDGTGTIDDQAARDLCTKLGCYDRTNHSKAMRALGNALTGSKNGGWTLTNPGKTRAAQLLKEMAE